LGKFYEQLLEELTVYTRQIAWLHTAPNPKQDAATTTNHVDPPMTRLETLRAQDAQPDIPAAGPGAYLVDYLFDAGPLVSTGQGSAALSWRDMAAWQSGTGIELQPWEARIVRALSHVYLSSSIAAKHPDCPAPYAEAPAPDQRTRVANTIRSIFGGFGQPQKAKA
jgi:hypothetical protein